MRTRTLSQRGGSAAAFRSHCKYDDFLRYDGRHVDMTFTEQERTTLVNIMYWNKCILFYWSVVGHIKHWWVQIATSFIVYAGFAHYLALYCQP